MIPSLVLGGFRADRPIMGESIGLESHRAFLREPRYICTHYKRWLRPPVGMNSAAPDHGAAVFLLRAVETLSL